MVRDRKILTGLRTNQIVGFVTVPSKNEKWKQWAFPLSYPKTQANNCTWDETCVCASFRVTEYNKLHEGRTSGYFKFFFLQCSWCELTRKISLPGKRKKENTSVCKTLYRVYQSFLLLVIDSFSRHLFDNFCKRHNVHREFIGAEIGPYTGNNGGLNNSHTRRVKCIIFLFQSEIIYPLLLF